MHFDLIPPVCEYSFTHEIAVPVQVGFPAKIEARFPTELLRRNNLFYDGNMDCGSSLSLELPDNAFNQINGQPLRLYDNSCELTGVFFD